MSRAWTAGMTNPVYLLAGEKRTEEDTRGNGRNAANESRSMAFFHG
jgi:hypothetical protein